MFYLTKVYYHLCIYNLPEQQVVVQANFAEIGPNLEVQPIRQIPLLSWSIIHLETPKKSLRLKLEWNMLKNSFFTYRDQSRDSPVASPEHLVIFSYNNFFAFFVSPCRLVTESSQCTLPNRLAFL